MKKILSTRVLCINNDTASFDNLYCMGQFSIDGKYS